MKFKNTDKLSLTAKYFLENKTYSNSMKGTPTYKSFWDEEERRCKEGYKVEGIRITGEHYFYLNYCPIKRVVELSDEDKLKEEEKKTFKKVNKTVSFPDFRDGDYEFFWIRYISENGISESNYKKLNLRTKIKDLNGGKHLIVGKARRMGYSYKTASLAIHKYTFFRNSLTLILASDKKYLFKAGAIMNMVSYYSNFINENVREFSRNKLISRQDEIKSGYKEIVNGIEVEKGYLSTIAAFSVKDNPDAARGKDCDLIIYEEAGTFPNLMDTYQTTEPSTRAGSNFTGQMIVFGTGGDVDGATMDFAEMFNDPETYGFLPFNNIWDENSEHLDCGFFHPAYIGQDGFIDKWGNSLEQEAIDSINRNREIKRKGKNKTALTQAIIEHPFNPKEAFMINTGNIFPTPELMKQLQDITIKPTKENTGVKGYLTLEGANKVTFEPDLDDLLDECEFPLRSNTTGCFVQYESPRDSEVFKYILGCDPYAQDDSKTSNSLGSILVYKRSTISDIEGDKIVAEYTARPSGGLNEFNEMARKICLYYNGTLMYENMINNLKAHFENKFSLYLLALTPNILRSTINSTVNRKYGLHMTADIKNELEIYIRDWLLEINPLGEPNYKYIYSKSLLKELIYYNDQGNFDRCFIPGTKILTNKGYKNIEEVNTSDTVITHKNRFMPVEELLISQCKDKIFKFSILGQYEQLECTRFHPIYTTNTTVKRSGKRTKIRYQLNDYKFKNAEDLKERDLVLIPKRKNLNTSTYSEEFLYLMGWYIADGYISPNNILNICFGIDELEIAQKLKKIIESLDNEVYITTKGHTDKNGRYVRPYKAKTIKADCTIVKASYANCYNLSKKSDFICNILREECGGPNNKRLSEKLFNSNNLLPLVIGYLEGDGHQKKKANYDGSNRMVIECATIYEILGKQIRQILIDNNIWCTIRYIKIKKQKGKDQYNLHITDPEGINLISKNSLKFKVKENTLKTSRKVAILKEEGFWVPIKKIETYSYNGLVYNLEVKEDHSYTAGNIIVHNCIAMMMVIVYKLQLTRIMVKKKETEIKDDFFSKKLFC